MGEVNYGWIKEQMDGTCIVAYYRYIRQTQSITNWTKTNLEESKSSTKTSNLYNETKAKEGRVQAYLQQARHGASSQARLPQAHLEAS